MEALDLGAAVRAVLPLAGRAPLNFAACGAFFSASRAASSASTLTPFLRFGSGFFSVFFSAIAFSLDGMSVRVKPFQVSAG
jgi:hypothetical protein